MPFSLKQEFGSGERQIQGRKKINEIAPLKEEQEGAQTPAREERYTHS